MRKNTIKILLLAFVALAAAVSAASFYTEYMSRERIKLLPVPKDYRNYYFLQSLGKSTHIIFSEFSAAEVFLSHIIDEDGDGKSDRITEYYPDTQKFAAPVKSSSKSYTDFNKMKSDIITGKAFENTYSYKMRSMDVLKFKLNEGRDVFKDQHGYAVKVYDPDQTSSIMSEFFFGKKDNEYDLVFKTNYYKIYKMKIMPPVPYSVYCRRSTDPYIKQIVEELLESVK